MIRYVTAVLVFVTCFGIFAQSPGSGKMLTFDGSNDYVDCGTGINLANSSFTVEMWAKRTVDASNRHLFTLGTGANNQGLHVRWQSTNTLRFAFWNDDYDLTGLSVDANWHHYAFTYDASNNLQTVYIDGILMGTASRNNDFSGSGTFKIGQAIGGWNEPWIGNIDEVRVWKTNLSQTQIRDWMCRKVTGSHPQYSNLQAYYQLDDGYGTTLTDSKNSNSGTLINGPSWTTSSAPFGDVSAYSYGSSNSTSVSATHADGSSFNVASFTGSPSGVHIYLVNQAPNSTTVPVGYTALETTRYYGTFVIGGTSPSYTVTYNYASNTNVNGRPDEPDYRLLKRENNADATWVGGSGCFDIDTSGNTISKCGQTGQNEFSVADETASPSFRPGSGYSLIFDGSDDQIVSSDLGVVTGNKTLCAWVKLGNTSQTGGGLVSFELNDGSVFDAIVYNETGNGWGFGSESFNRTAWSGVTETSTSEWVHLAATYASGSYKLYRNGVLILTSNQSLYSFSTNSRILVGKRHTGGSSANLYAEIDEVSVWNKVLTQTEIRDLMCKKITASHASFCNLLVYYRMDENTGSILKDYGGGIHGTLVNGPAYTTSGSPLGDDASWMSAVSSGSGINLSHPNGDNLTATMTAGTADLMVVYRMDEQPNVSTPPNGCDQLSQIDYFGVKLFGSSSGTYTVVYNYSGHPGIYDENNLKMASRPANNGTWSDLSATLDTNANTLTKTGQTGTEFILGSSNGNPLPVELIDFRTSHDSQVVSIDWKTASELNCDYFTVERSRNGDDWEELGRKKANGNTNEIIEYNLIDYSPYLGLSYYRLKNTDYGGNYKYSEISSVIFESMFQVSSFFEVFPNPTSSKIIVLNHAGGTWNLKIFNLQGVELTNFIGSAIITENMVELDLGELNAGSYLITNGAASVKIVKN